MIPDRTGPPIGRVVATEQAPSSPYQFNFWTAVDATIGIGAIVRVDGGDGTVVYAVVIDGVAYSDLGEALHDVLATDGQPDASPAPTVRREIRLWTARVLRHLPEEPMRPVPLTAVHAAGEADVELALRMESYLRTSPPTGVPVGVYVAGGMRAPVRLDANFVTGPESAHVNITGISGLATKTSAVEFLLGSLFATFPASKGGVAAVCFNVKGADLCFLDQPGTLTEEDRALYEDLELSPVPFEQVHYFAPFKADGINLNTLRSHPDLAETVQPLVWGLQEVLDYHDVLLNRDDLDAKAAAFIDFLADRVVDREFRDDWGTVHRVRTFTDLEGLFRAIFDGLEQSARGEIWRTHHIATIRKVRNRLLNISVRCKGLVSDDGSASDLPFGAFEDRSVYVIDVAGTDQLAQELVFTRVVSRLREHLERRDLGVDNVVVFVDELNKYAPAEGPETYVRKMLLDISERGRYLGLVLFSAQQFRSQVHRRVVGNAGTVLFGRMDMDELATPGYHVLSPTTRSKLAALPKGELMVRHPHFTHPVFLRFPRPAVMTGPDGLAAFPPAPDVPFEDAVVRHLVALDRNIAPAEVKAILVDRTETEVREALIATRRAKPETPLAYFRAALGPRVRRSVAPDRRAGSTPLQPVEDPYAS